MIRDVQAVMWKETRELVRQRSTLVSACILLAMFGVFLPARLGARELTSLSSLTGFVLLPFAVIVAFIADAFAGERERHTLESLLATRLPDSAILAGKIATAVAYAWGLVVAQSILAVATVNLVARPAQLVLYRPVVLLGGLGVGFGVALLMASLGVLVSLRAATVKQAQQVLAVSVAAVALVAVAGGALLPDAWLQALGRFVATAGETRLVALAALLVGIVDVLLLALCVARFRRARLILD